MVSDGAGISISGAQDSVKCRLYASPSSSFSLLSIPVPSAPSGGSCSPWTALVHTHVPVESSQKYSSVWTIHHTVIPAPVKTTPFIVPVPTHSCTSTRRMERCPGHHPAPQLRLGLGAEETGKAQLSCSIPSPPESSTPKMLPFFLSSAFPHQTCQTIR